MSFRNQVMGGANLIRPKMQSPNFSLAARTGWAVFENGDAYFFNITATGTVSSTSVIVSGSGDGVFIYDGTPAAGSLVVAITSQAGTDSFGNAYSGPGIDISAPGPGATKHIIQVRPDLKALLIYAAS